MARKNRPWEKKEEATPSNGGWGTLPQNLRPLADLPGELTPHRMGEVPVLVSVQNQDLADFSRRVYDEMNAKLIAAGGHNTVTEDELLRYLATAIYSRVSWVNRNMQPGTFRPDDYWSLPVAFALVVSAIGRVETANGIVYIPMWNAKTKKDLLLTREDWESVSRRLRALEPYGLRFVKAYEKAVEGVEKVMSLLRVDSPEETFFYAWVPPHVLETLISAILGLQRVRPVTPEEIGNYPLDAIPTYRIRGSWVLRWMHDFARLNEHRDVA